MAALARKQPAPQTWPEPGAPAGPAHLFPASHPAAEVFGRSGALELQQRLADHFAQSPRKAIPYGVRSAIVVGSAVSLWALIGAGVFALVG